MIIYKNFHINYKSLPDSNNLCSIHTTDKKGKKIHLVGRSLFGEPGRKFHILATPKGVIKACLPVQAHYAKNITPYWQGKYGISRIIDLER